MIRILLIAALCAASGIAAAEQFYKWQDAQGVWHYTQAPPEAGIRSERIDIVSGARRSADAPTMGSSAAAGVAAAGSTGTPGDVSAPNPEVEARRQVACMTAQANVRTIESNPTVTLVNPDGSERTLSAEEAQAQLEQARAQVTLFCSPPAA